MASDGSDEYVFAIPNFWQPSKLLLDLGAEAPSAFFANDLTSKPAIGYLHDVILGCIESQKADLSPHG